jgi:hypothetical protein
MHTPELTIINSFLFLYLFDKMAKYVSHLFLVRPVFVPLKVLGNAKMVVSFQNRIYVNSTNNAN